MTRKLKIFQTNIGNKFPLKKFNDYYNENRIRT